MTVSATLLVEVPDATMTKSLKLAGIEEKVIEVEELASVVVANATYDIYFTP
jgi:hypothetical protein